MNSPILVAIGQLPPPVSGFAYITERMIAALRDDHPAITVNIAAPAGATGLRKHFIRFARTLRACLTLVGQARIPERVCYIACEGGLGLGYTLMAVTTAKLAGYKIYLHHHSFAYIDRPRGLMHAVLQVGGDITHIFLCAIMRDKFEAAYSRIVHSAVLSNAAFVPLDSALPEPRNDETLVLGHLSNLTREKGLHLFLDLLREAIGAGLNVRGILAGPAALDEDRAMISAVVTELAGRLDYRGSVYGEAKAQFYRDIDVFIFPTQYVNEAQPTVIFEAQATGCSVVAYERGCIASQIGTSGIVLAQDEAFISRAMAWIASTAESLGRAERKAIFEQRSAEARAVLAGLFQSAAKSVQTREFE